MEVDSDHEAGGAGAGPSGAPSKDRKRFEVSLTLPPARCTLLSTLVWTVGHGRRQDCCPGAEAPSWNHADITTLGEKMERSGSLGVGYCCGQLCDLQVLISFSGISPGALCMLSSGTTSWTWASSVRQTRPPPRVRSAPWLGECENLVLSFPSFRLHKTDLLQV